jgi:uncharacterized membrane protein YphA (DoxX/SURF4 family)
MNIVLWIIQVLLTLLFLFAGGTKLYFSMEQMKAMSPPNAIMLPGLLLKFIGVCEVLGAFGLILPGLLRIRPGLTPLAAAGLTIIMIGAVAFTIMTEGVVMAITPLITLILTMFVGYGRWRLAPHRG